ncbi:MAG: YraN family protein [Gammaproteobacteria bacterium]
MTQPLNSHQTGKQAEAKALVYLRQQGLIEIERNFHTRYGEIDLIMLDNTTTVFVEVRSRKHTGYMNVIETIDAKKVKRIILASRIYLQARGENTELYRFDVVTLSGTLHSPEINWIKNAFSHE